MLIAMTGLRRTIIQFGNTSPRLRVHCLVHPFREFKSETQFFAKSLGERRRCLIAVSFTRS